MKKKLASLLVLTAALVFFSGLSYSQILTGKIDGTVVDEGGNPLPGATVEISSPALMGGLRPQISSERGAYRFSNLAPGIYKLTISLDGFEKTERVDLKVSVEGTTTVNVVLKQAALNEAVTVTAVNPRIDVTKTSMAVYFGKEELEKVPSGRFSFFDIIKQAPGVQQADQDSQYSVGFGSNLEANSYKIDGVDINNPEYGSGTLWVPADILDEVEISGVGSQAEYGQYTGAVVNMVTKSGGNRFAGSLSYYGQFDQLTADNNPQPGTSSYHREKFYNATVTLGGPIVKDKVWFFSAFEKVEDTSSYWQQDPAYPNEWPMTKGFFKLSAQLSSKHKLVGSLFYNSSETTDTSTPYKAPESLGSQIGRGPAWNLMYTWLINDNTYFEFKYGGFYRTINSMPLYSTLDDPPHYDGYTGITSNGMVWPWKYNTSRNQVNANLSHFAEDFLEGDHDFRAGVQYNKGTSNGVGGYSGGRFYYDYDGAPYYLFQQSPFYYGGAATQIGAFVDDSWKIGPRVVLNFGLRFDHSEGSIPSYPVMDGWTETSQRTAPLDDLIIWNTISPRIGLAVQLTSDQKTLLKASFGRYYDALHIGNWESPGPNVTDWSMYLWNGEASSWDLLYTQLGTMSYSIDPDQKNPYADQFSVGLVRELFPKVALSATLIYKKERNLLGWVDRGATYVEQSMTSPDNGQTYTVWNQTSPLGSNDYWITNPPGYGQTYRAAIIEFTKKYSKHWMLNSSVTWSKSEGLNTAAHSEMQMPLTWLSKFGRDPNDLINARGLLQNDRRWMFKAQASYSFPWGIETGLNYIYQTGKPIPTYVRIYPDQGVREILASPRSDDNRLKPWSMLDLRLQKTLGLYKTMKFALTFDIFNVFNSNTVTDNASYNMWAENYNAPLSIFFPRRTQLGLRIDF